MRAGKPAGGHALVAYFGYGSLVNAATHRTAIVRATPTRLQGWRRTWRPRPDMPGFPAALLTVRPDTSAACDGLLIYDRADNLAAIDAREARYRRVKLAPDALQRVDGHPADCPIWLYVADDALPPHREPPRILQSYLDAVMQGFLAVHGDAGLERFLAETDAFHTPIHRDRHQPIYPRSVMLTDRERELFDRLVAGIARPG